MYQADLFLEKNKDYVVAEHQALLTASKCVFVANLFPSLPEESSKSSKFSSIGLRFKVIRNIPKHDTVMFTGRVTDSINFLFCYLPRDSNNFTH